MSAYIAQRAGERERRLDDHKVRAPSCPYCEHIMEFRPPVCSCHVHLHCPSCSLAMAVPTAAFLAWAEAGL